MKKIFILLITLFATNLVFANINGDGGASNSTFENECTVKIDIADDDNLLSVYESDEVSITSKIADLLKAKGYTVGDYAADTELKLKAGASVNMGFRGIGNFVRSYKYLSSHVYLYIANDFAENRIILNDSSKLRRKKNQNKQNAQNLILTSVESLPDCDYLSF